MYIFNVFKKIWEGMKYVYRSQYLIGGQGPPCKEKTFEIRLERGEGAGHAEDREEHPGQRRQQVQRP